MPYFVKNRFLLILTLFLLGVAFVPLTLSVLSEQQETRSQAAASTTLSFEPISTTTPIQKTVGEQVSLDIMVNPGTNQVTFVKLQVKFDPSKVELIENPFVLNSAAFPVVVEGPIVQSDSFAIALSIGSDSSKSIKTPVKVGTLKFRTLAPTGSTSTIVSFSTGTLVLSLGGGESATTNVLSTTVPASIRINSLPTPTPTPSPSPTPLPPTPVPDTSLKFNLLLHGIGKGGDNANPQALGNASPLNTLREVSVEVYNTQNVLLVESGGQVTYDPVSGSFRGTIDLGNILTQNGSYTVKVKMDQYLKTLVPGIQALTVGRENSLPTTALITGDINGDNQLNIVDYNLLMGCYSDLLPADNCNQEFQFLADLTDDGNVNQFDYNLFIREISNLSGQ